MVADKFCGREYWHNLYASKKGHFDWYSLGYDELKPLLNKYLDKSSCILHVGVGSSTLQVGMASDGYQQVINIDYADSVIQQWCENNKHSDQLIYKACDITQPQALDGQRFDGVLDKGTLDGLLCSDNDFDDGYEMLLGCSRSLKASQYFVLISFGSPAVRMEMLQEDELQWEVQFYKVRKVYDTSSASPTLHVDVLGPYTETGTPAEFPMNASTHYVYVCQKLCQ